MKILLIKKNKGITLIELMISSAIALGIVISIMTMFFNYLNIWHQGETEIALHSQAQLLLKVVYNDLKRANPPIYITTRKELDKGKIVDVDDIKFYGESNGNLKVNSINIISTDKNIKNGGEELHITYFNLKDDKITRYDTYYFVEKTNLKKKTQIRTSINYMPGIPLIEPYSEKITETGIKTIKSLHFIREYSGKSIVIKAKLEKQLKKNSKINKTEDISFRIGITHPMVTVGNMLVRDK